MHLTGAPVSLTVSLIMHSNTIMPTISTILTDAIPRLAEAGVDSPRLDAELMLGHVLRHERAWVWSHPEVEVDEAQTARFATLMERRLAREPLPHLLGAWEFYRRSFRITPDVLIPRSETELLVEAVVRWGRSHGARRMADIGAGSGVIAVTLAAEMPEMIVAAVDISPAALAIASKNARSHGVARRITVLQGDLLAPLIGSPWLPLDGVVANLPYIAAEDMPGLMPEVRDYEPKLALCADDGGMALIRRLVQDAPLALRPGGLLALEVGLGQAEPTADLLRARGFGAVQIVNDYAGIPRHVLGELGMPNE
jgi:release factor glutamine methyltransferase